MKLLFGALWALAFSAGFCVFYLVAALVTSAHFNGKAASSAISVSPWLLAVALALGLVGFVLAVAGKLPGTR